jgi:hypothetical protein
MPPVPIGDCRQHVDAVSIFIKSRVRALSIDAACVNLIRWLAFRAVSHYPLRMEKRAFAEHRAA